MMGERYRRFLDCGVDPLQQAQAERNTSSFANVVSLPGELKLPSLAQWVSLCSRWQMLKQDWHDC